MKKKLLLIVLTICLAFLVIAPKQAFAMSNGIVISNKKYDVAPGVVEYERITNNASLSSQLVGHVMEITLGGTAEIAIGYNDYNVDAFVSGRNWAMRRTTEQAQAMETRAGVNVVGAVNGDFFNMSNGEPTGTVVMQGKTVKKPNGYPYFYVDSEGKAHIETKNLYALPEGVKEAINVNALLVKDGNLVIRNDTAAAPRTAIGIKADGTVVLYMVDGRQAPYSVGTTLDELAQIMKDIGCVIAGNLDGGGSSTFATQREGEANDNGAAGLTLRCRPSDGYERTVSTTIMVISKAVKTGEFDHASITPSNDLYTPGSEVQFNAIGVDAAGGPASLPSEGLKWIVTSGNELGTINEATGLFTSVSGKTGTVEVALKYNDEIVGTTTLELQWPDKLSFNNTSVSLDFGEESDLTFVPTYKGRSINYKDGDFTWELNPTSYKHTVLAETKAANSNTGYAGNGKKDISISITGSRTPHEYEYSAWGSTWAYGTQYTELNNTLTYGSDGSINISVVLRNTASWTYSGAYVNEEGKTVQDRIPVTTPLQNDQTFIFTVGKFSNNKFSASDKNSLRGVITVKHEALSADIDIVVGMEPYVLMDFEDKKDASGNTISAKDYWTLHVGSSGDRYNMNGRGQLTIEEMRESRLWIRDTTGKGVVWPVDENGKDINGIVSASEDSNVRFGDYAMRIAWDFTKINTTTVAAADFGFSAIVYVEQVQPTKIGMWINVPKNLANDNSVIKGIFVGDGKIKDDATLGYYQMNDDGTMTFVEGKNVAGTTSYSQYYSYDTDGNVTGSTLSDWAGKGWIWVETDVSGYQMPIGIQRGYTVRITSPQNCTKGEGYIYMDNLQFIYGTNTNDINNPEIGSVTERTTGKSLEGNPTFNNGELNFEATFADYGKYASGIDKNTIKVYVDGYDMTNSAEITETGSTLYLAHINLKNGIHNIKVRVKDTYGNETIKTYYFTVDDPNGTSSEIRVAKPNELPLINNKYTLTVLNDGDRDISSAEVSIEIPEKYIGKYTCLPANGYNLSTKIEGNIVTLSIAIGPSASQGKELAYITFDIPADSKEGDTFVYSVPSGKYVVDSENILFSDVEQEIALTAKYKLFAQQKVIGFATLITVLDTEGNVVNGASIYYDGAEIGKTDQNGELSYVFTRSGRITLYAIDANGRSWNTDVVINQALSENDGKPFGIQNNGVKDGSSEFNVTWLTSIEGSLTAQSYIRYSDVYKTAEELAGLSNILGRNTIISFTETNVGNSYRLNEISLSGLKENTTYYYQVGTEIVDGVINWSEVLTFTTAPKDKDADTNFFILGDIQTNDTANLSYALNMINYNAKQAGYKMDFGIQTGDAIDNVTAFNNWRNFLTTVNASKLYGVPLIHALGNHEYYGDANGDISGSLYGLPKTTQGSFYSFEYGSIYVGVINNGGNILNAIEELKEDVKNTKCSWKIVVTHEPIYGTESLMEESRRLKVVQGFEEAGIDFVFGGDDHAYARTYPLKGDKILAENSREGVVYYIVGDLSSKDNEYHNRDYYVYSKPHNEYQGMYLQVRATKEEITITAVQYNGEVPYDIYTVRKTDCELGKHTYDETSIYDIHNKTLTCSLCNHVDEAINTNYSGKATVDSEDSVILENGVVKVGWFTYLGEVKHTDQNGIIHEDKDGQIYRYDVSKGKVVCAICGEEATSTDFTGRLKTYDGIGEVMLTLGNVMKGWFPYGDEMIHADENGIIHNTVTRDTATCLNNGHIEADCLTCGSHYKNQEVTWSKGHAWDENHVCTVCHKEGIDISKATLIIFDEKVSYTGSGIKPSSRATYDGYTLIARSDRYGYDAYISYSNNTDVGIGTVTYEGRGNYYGTISANFEIYPSIVSNLSYTSTKTSLTITWKASRGSQSYVVYEKIDDNYNFLAETTDNRLTINGLKPNESHTYVIKAKTTVSEKEYMSLEYSKELVANTLPNNTFNSISGVRLVVNGEEVKMVTVDRVNYLLLPSLTDLSNVKIEVLGVDNNDYISVGGDKGSKIIANNFDDINILTLASRNTDGSYVIFVANGDREAFNIIVKKSSNISSIHITSSDPVSAGRDYVDAVKGNKATGTVKIINENNEIVYDGSLNQIKARGNSTFKYYPKKSYQIKLATATDLLGNGEDVDTWVLLASYGDPTLMHDKIMKDLAKKLGDDFVASCDFTDLYYDGEYRGTYLITEKNYIGSTGIDIDDLEAAFEEINATYGENKNSLTGTNKYGSSYKYIEGLTNPSDITGGYLIELNNDFIDEVCGFITRRKVGFNVKSPEYCSNEAMKYISEYYQEFEDAVFAKDANGKYTGYNETTGKYYYDYCDLDSLVRAFILQEISGNCDAFISSMFLYKDKGEKLNAGLIWDSEMTFGTGWAKETSPKEISHNYLAEALIEIPSFKEAVKKYYTDVMVPEIQLLLSDKGMISENANRLADSAEMNYILWPLVRVGHPESLNHLWENRDYDFVVQRMKTWLNDRFNALNKLYCNHKYDNKYQSDGTYHWHLCTICGAKGETHIHEYSHNCDTTCDYCGNIRLVNHKWDSGVVTKEATCTSEGQRKYTCTLCKQVKLEKIAKIDHNYSENWKFDEESHYHECEHCHDKKDSASHTFGEIIVIKAATCEANGEGKYVCSECGYEKKVVIEKLNHNYSENWKYDEESHYHECEHCHDKKDSASHTFGEIIVIKAATCEANGEGKYVCSECGYEKKVVIEKLNHNYSENWKYDEESHYHECEHCHDKKDSASHEWDNGAITKEATTKEEGSKTYTCKVCGKEKVEAIAKKTGCNCQGTTQSIWFILSVLGLAFIIRKKKTI